MNQKPTIPSYSALSATPSARFDRPTDIRPAMASEVFDALQRFTIAFDIFDSPDLPAKLALIAESVEGEPLWAIRDGVRDFCLGKVKRKRTGLPLASEFGPHVAELTSWAREKARAEVRVERERRDDPPAEGDGVKFGMTPEEMKLCGKHFAAMFLEEPRQSRPSFFAQIKARDIHAWLSHYREGQSA